MTFHSYVNVYQRVPKPSKYLEIWNISMNLDEFARVYGEE